MNPDSVGMNISGPVARKVASVLRAVGETSPDEQLLKRYLADAASFGETTQLSADEARIGVSNYLMAEGKLTEAVEVSAMYEAGKWPTEPALGFEAKRLPSAKSQLPVEARPMLDGVRGANEERLELARAIESGLSNIQSISTNGYSTTMWTADAGEMRVFLRGIRDMTGIGYWEADRSNNLMNALAEMMGAPELTLASVLMPTPPELRGTIDTEVIMVLPHAGEGFRAVGTQGSITNPEAARGIREEDRISGALLSYLTRHNDARANNILVRTDPSGAVETRFIDHDNVLGRGAWYVARYGGQPRDDFFKGQSLGYATDLSSFENLPARDRALVEGLVAMSAEQVAAMFDLNVAEATVLREQAQHVRDFGLDGAITRFPVTARG